MERVSRFSSSFLFFLITLVFLHCASRFLCPSTGAGLLQHRQCHDQDGLNTRVFFYGSTCLRDDYACETHQVRVMEILVLLHLIILLSGSEIQTHLPLGRALSDDFQHLYPCQAHSPGADCAPLRPSISLRGKGHVTPSRCVAFPFRNSTPPIRCFWRNTNFTGV